MGSRVLIAPDKFKGTLTAAQAAQAIAEGWRAKRPDDTIDLFPITDGGDGFGEILSSLSKAEPHVVKTMDAAHRPCEATWWFDWRGRTAIIESARVVGLAQLPAGKYHPFELDTEGLAAVMEAALAEGAQRCVLGIGGSATNDGGFGLARGLGWQFFGQHDEKIVRWPELKDLALIRPRDTRKWFEEVTVAVDVQNPLLGANGCTRVYGPQKGIRPQDFEFAESALGQLVAVIEKQLHLRFASEPGAGAAGGLGYGLKCFAQARLVPGFELFIKHSDFSQRLAQADVVVTGEGAIDESSLMGKGVGQLAALAQQSSKPCFAVAGRATVSGTSFRNVYAMTQLTSVENALARPEHWLRETASRAASQWRT